ncbi:MAG: BMP family ABC transporter substrate-binding protein [Negativicutes bacterium]|jgi:basic membrane lipoprotein Med (substrate-binding protein (PBP1-ABC) superfamily)
MKKLIVIVVLALFAMFAITGCGSVEKNESTSTQIKLALIIDPASAVDDQYNNQLEVAIKNSGVKYGNRLVTDIIRVPVNTSDRKKYIDEQIGNGKYNVVIDSDLYYTRNVVELAEKYPQTKFVIVDEDIATVGKNSNILIINYNAFQEGFIAGYSAGIKAKKAVAVIALKANPNSYKLIRGFKAGINYADKSLKIIKEAVEISQYNADTVFSNEQKLGRSVFDAVTRAVSQGADVVIAESMIPIAPVVSAVHDAPVMLVATEIEYTNLKNSANYLSCVIEEYEFGVNQVIAQVMNNGFRGGTLEMNFLNDGLKFRSPDKANQEACEKLIKELLNNPKLLANLEGVQ